jgi:lysophospholipase L1-like esterase
MIPNRLLKTCFPLTLEATMKAKRVVFYQVEREKIEPPKPEEPKEPEKPDEESEKALKELKQWPKKVAGTLKDWQKKLAKFAEKEKLPYAEKLAKQDEEKQPDQNPEVKEKPMSRAEFLNNLEKADKKDRKRRVSLKERVRRTQERMRKLTFKEAEKGNISHGGWGDVPLGTYQTPDGKKVEIAVAVTNRPIEAAGFYMPVDGADAKILAGFAGGLLPTRKVIEAFAKKAESKGGTLPLKPGPSLAREILAKNRKLAQKDPEVASKLAYWRDNTSDPPAEMMQSLEIYKASDQDLHDKMKNIPEETPVFGPTKMPIMDPRQQGKETAPIGVPYNETIFLMGGVIGGKPLQSGLGAPHGGHHVDYSQKTYAMEAKSKVTYKDKVYSVATTDILNGKAKIETPDGTIYLPEAHKLFADAKIDYPKIYSKAVWKKEGEVPERPGNQLVAENSKKDDVQPKDGEPQNSKPTPVPPPMPRPPSRKLTRPKKVRPESAEKDTSVYASYNPPKKTAQAAFQREQERPSEAHETQEGKKETLFVGDSLTEGYAPKLREIAPGLKTVDLHEQGRGIGVMLTEFQSYVQRKKEAGKSLKGTTVVFLAGTNNIFTDSVQSIKSHLGQMYAAAKENGMKVVAATIPPVADSTYARHWAKKLKIPLKQYGKRLLENWEKMNNWIANQGREGKVDVVVNLAKYFDDGHGRLKEEYRKNGDGVHFADYGRMAELIKKGIDYVNPQETNQRKTDSNADTDHQNPAENAENVDLKGFFKNGRSELEKVINYTPKAGLEPVAIKINLPPDFNPNDQTVIVAYATPNGNTIANTEGKEGSADFHDGLQHLSAQTRVLRNETKKTDQKVNYVTAIMQPKNLSWPQWAQGNEGRAYAMQNILDHIQNQIPGREKNIALAGHSGGGSFMFEMLEKNQGQLPAEITRLCNFDAMYRYDRSQMPFIIKWLESSPKNQFNVVFHDDSDVRGGTNFKNTHDLIEDFEKKGIVLTKVEYEGFNEWKGQNGQISIIEIAGHKHHSDTVLWGFRHSMATGTKLEGRKKLKFSQNTARLKPYIDRAGERILA